MKRMSVIGVAFGVAIWICFSFFVKAATPAAVPDLSTIEGSEYTIKQTADTSISQLAKTGKFKCDKAGMYEFEFWGGGGCSINNSSCQANLATRCSCYVGGSSHKYYGGCGGYVRFRVKLKADDIIEWTCPSGSPAAYSVTSNYGLYTTGAGEEIEEHGSSTPSRYNGYTIKVTINGSAVCTVAGGKSADGNCSTDGGDSAQDGVGGDVTWNSLSGVTLIESKSGKAGGSGCRCYYNAGYTTKHWDYHKKGIEDWRSDYYGAAKVKVTLLGYDLIYDKGITNN